MPHCIPTKDDLAKYTIYHHSTISKEVDTSLKTKGNFNSLAIFSLEYFASTDTVVEELKWKIYPKKKAHYNTMQLSYHPKDV